MKLFKLSQKYIIALIIFVYLMQLVVAFAHYELTRYKLPGFWHTLRGQPFYIEGSDADWSQMPAVNKFQEVWEFILKQDT